MTDGFYSDCDARLGAALQQSQKSSSHKTGLKLLLARMQLKYELVTCLSDTEHQQLAQIELTSGKYGSREVVEQVQLQLIREAQQKAAAADQVRPWLRPIYGLDVISAPDAADVLSYSSKSTFFCRRAHASSILSNLVWFLSFDSILVRIR